MSTQTTQALSGANRAQVNLAPVLSWLAALRYPAIGITTLLALWWLGGPINELLSLYSSEQSLTSMAASSLVILPLFSGVLGLLGAWLAVGRHLGDIEPNF